MKQEDTWAQDKRGVSSPAEHGRRGMNLVPISIDGYLEMVAPPPTLATDGGAIKPRWALQCSAFRYSLMYRQVHPKVMYNLKASSTASGVNLTLCRYLLELSYALSHALLQLQKHAVYTYPRTTDTARHSLSISRYWTGMA